jgi:CRISPR-associated protein Cmr4
MYKIAKPIFISCLTPTHVGSGSDLGHVDLPIQRESHTGFPKFEASSLKGALRERLESVYGSISDRVKLHLAFGYDSAQANESVKAAFEGEKATLNKEYAGALAFSDARLLLFPVKSMKGVFSLITCPYVLERFSEELGWCKKYFSPQAQTNIDCFINQVANLCNEDLKDIGEDAFCFATSTNSNWIDDKHIILEEYLFNKKDASCGFDIDCLVNCLNTLMRSEHKNIVIISDNDYKDFVELFTEKITRIKIDNATGIVAKGQLFSEEFLPAESVLYSLVMASPIFQSKTHDFRTEAQTNKKEEEKEVLNFFFNGLSKANYTLQIGGDATLGKGIVKINTISNSPKTTKEATNGDQN